MPLGAGTRLYYAYIMSILRLYYVYIMPILCLYYAYINFTTPILRLYHHPYIYAYIAYLMGKG
jgi:hypothetical protein